MALTSTVHVFDVTLSDVDRGVYDTFSLKVARHPSETAESVVTRVLAWSMEACEGLGFGGGVSSTEEPALHVRDWTGRLLAWIDVGTPDPARLHKASKACDRVVVYCHKEPTAWLRSFAGQRIHAPEHVRLVLLDPRFVAAVAERIEKRTTMAISVVEGEVYVDVGGTSFTTTPTRRGVEG